MGMIFGEETVVLLFWVGRVCVLVVAIAMMVSCFGVNQSLASWKSSGLIFAMVGRPWFAWTSFTKVRMCPLAGWT